MKKIYVCILICVVIFVLVGLGFVCLFASQERKASVLYWTINCICPTLMQVVANIFLSCLTRPTIKCGVASGEAGHSCLWCVGALSRPGADPGADQGYLAMHLKMFKGDGFTVFLCYPTCSFLHNGHRSIWKQHRWDILLVYWILNKGPPSHKLHFRNLCGAFLLKSPSCMLLTSSLNITSMKNQI